MRRRLTKVTFRENVEVCFLDITTDNKTIFDIPLEAKHINYCESEELDELVDDTYFGSLEEICGMLEGLRIADN